MTLDEVKKQILTLIEEYDEKNQTNFTNDPDINAKINHSIDNIQIDSNYNHNNCHSNYSRKNKSEVII